MRRRKIHRKRSEDALDLAFRPSKLRGSAAPNPEVERQVLAFAETMRVVRINKRKRSIKGMTVGAAVALMLLWSGLEPPFSNLVGVVGLTLVFLIAREALSTTNEKPVYAVTGASGEVQPESYEPRELTDEERRIQEELREAARRLQTCYKIAQFTAVASLVAGLLAAFLVSGFAPEYAFWCMPAGCAVGVALLIRIQSRGDEAANESMKRLELVGVEAAGAIVDFLKSADPSIQPAAMNVLTRILRSMHASDGKYLAAEDRRYLYSYLAPDVARERPAFALAILKMVEQLADRDAEPRLQELLGMPNPTGEHDQALLKAAYYAMQSLGHASEQLSRRGNLLSPAFAPEGGDSLLRAAVSRTDPPEQLLRSSDAG